MAGKRMDDIKPFSQEDENFRVTPISDEDSEDDVSEVSDESAVVNDKVKIHFSALVRLIASRNFDKVLERRANDEIILPADLLADLASDHDEPSTNYMPFIFVGGLLAGAVISYFILKFV
ncbi:hypothetical protein HZA41_01820 [Candidatus Peregrinibacteria bacterium]|nr:hypothetical protein [Candidatus Peregrinibacteria bacterium]